MTKQNKTDFDVIIVGGGLVGASLAVALSSAKLDMPLKIGVIENFKFDDTKQPSFDSRTVALSYSSKEIFNSLGVWDSIEALGACAIKEIHVSDKGHLGLSHLRASEQDTEALGFVVENQTLGSVLHSQLSEYNNISLFCPASLNNFSISSDFAEIEISQTDDNGLVETSHLRAKLLVAADGAQSFVREQSDVKTRQLAYNQTAIITNVACDQPHNKYCI